MVILSFRKKKFEIKHTKYLFLSKLANEIIAKTYIRKSKTQIIGLRFFQYGEWEDQTC